MEKLLNKVKGLNEELKIIEKILIKFENEINRQSMIIEKTKKYCMKTHMTIEEYEKLLEIIGG